MSDTDIHFPPGQRREPPKFEPPPWEREQFEELARTKKAQEPVVPVEPEPEAASEEAVDAVAEQAEIAPPEAAVSEEAVGPEARKLSDEHIEVLLTGLRAEEPRVDEAYWKVTIVTGIALAVIGLGVSTWGVVALLTPKEPGATGTFLVMGLLVPGLGFFGAGVWLVVKSLRQQGVL